MAGIQFLRDAFRCQKPLGPQHAPVRGYATPSPAKPRPYGGKPKPQPIVGTKPLVGTRNPASPMPAASPTPKVSPDLKPKTGTVVAPYWRISIGVLLCGSIVYSMVYPILSLKLLFPSSPTCMPVHRAPPTRSRLHRRARHPRKTRIRHKSNLAHASPDGRLHQSPAARDSSVARNA